MALRTVLGTLDSQLQFKLLSLNLSITFSELFQMIRMIMTCAIRSYTAQCRYISVYFGVKSRIVCVSYRLKNFFRAARGLVGFQHLFARCKYPFFFIVLTGPPFFTPLFFWGMGKCMVWYRMHTIP